MDAEHTLVLVDGSSYLYRAFHAIPPLNNSAGKPTNAVYGVAGMLRRLRAEYMPAFAAVVFDASGKTFRDELYGEYKAHRPAMPDELVEQIEPLHELVRALGFPLLEIGGVEADDVIGTLARLAQAEGLATLVSTSDKDLAQIVNGSVTLVNTMSNTVLDRAGVEQKFGVSPEQMVDYLALIGDSSDNIPGVPKVGPKTAAKWLAEHKTLEEIIAHADEFRGKIGENLRAHLNQLELSKHLVTLRCDVELGFKPRDLALKPPDTAQLREIFTRLEFTSWLKQLDEEVGNGGATPPVKPDYETVLDEPVFKDWLARLEHAELIAFDTETTSLNYMEAAIVGVSFAVDAGRAAYVPCGHCYEGAPQQLERNYVLEALRPLLENPDKAKLGHHLKYDAHVLANYGITLGGMRYDTMLESYVLNSVASRHDMDSLAEKYLGTKTVRFEDVAGKGAKQKRFDEIELDTAAPYAAEDADITLRLHQTLWPKLAQYPPLKTLFEDLEMPLAQVLLAMERNGVLVDIDMLAHQSSELAEQMAALEEQAYEIAGRKFNLGSPKQLQEILFQERGLPVLRKTPKGQPSTAEDVLQELAADYDLPHIILEHRALVKLKSTYTDRLAKDVNPATGRVHTSYHQAVAATGRLSSSEPNLQNIPVRRPAGRLIRKAFIAPPGHRILAADYSQIELRIMAHLSGDRGLLNAFAAGEDIHRATAAEVFGSALETVSDDQRRAAKAINFGLIYGMSAFGLGRQLNIDRQSAQEYVELYFKRYPGVKAFMDATRERAREQGFVETVFGRRLYLPDIKARNARRRQYAERTAINAPMQGTAADIIKRAMLAIHAWLATSRARARMIMQVHDELVFEVTEDGLDDVQEQVIKHMVEAGDLDVPLTVDTGIGTNWNEAH